MNKIETARKSLGYLSSNMKENLRAGVLTHEPELSIAKYLAIKEFKILGKSSKEIEDVSDFQSLRDVILNA